jgi:hypothetical protein
MILGEHEKKKWGNLDLNQKPAGYGSAINITAVIHRSPQKDSMNKG